jgi:hypothetical protein
MHSAYPRLRSAKNVADTKNLAALCLQHSSADVFQRGYAKRILLADVCQAAYDIGRKEIRRNKNEKE